MAETALEGTLSQAGSSRCIWMSYSFMSSELQQNQRIIQSPKERSKRSDEISDTTRRRLRGREASLQCFLPDSAVLFLSLSLSLPSLPTLAFLNARMKPLAREMGKLLLPLSLVGRSVGWSGSGERPLGCFILRLPPSSLPQVLRTS